MIATTLFSTVALAAAATLAEVNVERVFVPVGFDDNDELTVVLDGYLPSSCYKLAHTEATFDEASSSYTVRQFAWVFPRLCLFIRAPFSTEVALGRGKAGTYAVKGRGAQERTLVVAASANPGPDDFLYAPVDSARVESDLVTGARTAVLQGRLTSSCMSLKDVRVVDSGETLQVLPFAAFEDGIQCVDHEMPFTKRVPLPSGLATGRHLLHVRSMNGKAVNTVFSVAPPVTR